MLLKFHFHFSKEELLTLVSLPKVCPMSEKAITIFTSFLNEGVFLGLYCVPFFPPCFCNEEGVCVQFRPLHDIMLV